MQSKTLTLTQANDIEIAYCHELEEVELSRRGFGKQSIVLTMEDFQAVANTLNLLRITQEVTLHHQGGKAK